MKYYAKKYDENKNVYEAAMERIDFIFKNFEKIYLSFSGGKDSGVMLNLCLDYMKKNGIKNKIGLMAMDNECNYTHSLEFMHSIIQNNIEYLDVYWCCLPITIPCTVSSYEIDYQTWGVNDEERWVSPMPKNEYIVNLEKAKQLGMTFYRENMLDKDFYDGFSEWYAQGKTCANLIGIRTDESLNRFRAIMNPDKVMINNFCWTKKNTEHSYNCYPIYDWKVKDIWTANAKFDWEYNKLYDIFYKAGLTIAQMRVASPFMSESKSSLNLYRIIDPHVWQRLCGRVSGANFLATYGKQLNYKNIKLPDGHTWKSFTKFLLATLPEESSKNFKMRFAQSIKFWWRVGRGLSEEVIDDLIDNNIEFRFGEYTRHGRQNKRCVRMLPPDHLDMLKSNASDITSWKRYAITILKNDHTCKYMGLAPTKEQAERQKYIQQKYANI
jgi:predicted phosphoadenosine phosphosulfate sulfurtransferase